MAWCSRAETEMQVKPWNPFSMAKFGAETCKVVGFGFLRMYTINK